MRVELWPEEDAVSDAYAELELLLDDHEVSGVVDGEWSAQERTCRYAVGESEAGVLLSLVTAAQSSASAAAAALARVLELYRGDSRAAERARTFLLTL